MIKHKKTTDLSKLNKKIEVAVRMRPLLKGFEDQEVWLVNKQKKIITSLPRKSDSKVRTSLAIQATNSYEFNSDYLYDQFSQNQQIYEQCCSKLIRNLFEHENNGTVFMYGQTTSGKTFTMLGDQNNSGIVMYSLTQIFEKVDFFNKKAYNSLSQQPLNRLAVVISYLQIYNEQVNDLLNPDLTNLKIVDSSVPKLTQFEAGSFEQAVQMLMCGQEKRVYREKDIHDHSSRSHTIFQIKIVEKSPSDLESEIPLSLVKSKRKSKVKGILNLVDLAGSQRLQDDDTNDQTGYINKSLFVLSNVIHRLASLKKKQNQYSNNGVHIPFRDSKLTQLLSPSLLGNSQTIVICTTSPASVNFNQTLSTLRFAAKSRKVQFKSPIPTNQSNLTYFSNISYCSILNESSILPTPNISNFPSGNNSQKTSKIMSNNLVMQTENKVIDCLKQQNSILKKNLFFLQQKSIHNSQQSFLENKSKNVGSMISVFKNKYLAINKQNNSSQENFKKKENWYRKVSTLCQQYKKNVQLLQNQYFKALINATSLQYGLQRKTLQQDLKIFQNSAIDSLTQISSIRNQN